ncbi:MAG TPA: ThiF family adenylyltransferase [Candidatus Limnocylindrales bacterium]|nr:ThiF family adenylyltransferase [Candidatus Limnocylindrales bacterium]
MYPTLEKQHESSRERPRVLVVGAGALGCAAARTLAQDGSVAITLVDFDDVELSNLQRQVLYNDEDLGRSKVAAAAARLAEEFGVTIETVHARFDDENGAALVAGADLVIDATDDPATKFLIARLSSASRAPSVYAGVARTGGQWMLVVPGKSACLECVFPKRAFESQNAEGCAALGILAPVAGFVGAMQAITALAFLHDPASVVAGRLHLYELTGARSRHIDFPIDDACGCRAARSKILPGTLAADAALELRFEETRS